MKPRERSRVRRYLITLACGFALAGLLTPAAQAEQRAAASIIGGEDATIEAFPSLSFIEARLDKNHGFACTGTVIAPRVILTAGHCVLDIEGGKMTPPQNYAVATGVADVRQAGPANVFDVSRALVYPKFDPSNLHGDAGLLVLSTPTAAPPIPLAGGTDASLYAGGAPVQLAGWGLNDAIKETSSSILQTTTAQVQAPSFCRKHAGTFYAFYSPGVQMCTTTPPKHTSGGCFGDSGGPVIAHRADGSAVEVGIVSTGAPKCNTKQPNIFTRVDRVATWAAEWVSAVELGTPAPKVVVPKATLPRMTPPDARTLVERAMRIEFGHRFTRGKEVRVKCSRLARARFRCPITWFQGPNDYFGSVTVFYAIHRNNVFWDARFTIQWVNDRCWFHSGHRRSCEIHSKHR